MLTHFGVFRSEHMQLHSSFPTHRPKKKSGLSAAILFSVFSNNLIQESTFVGLLLQPFPVFQVASEVEHLLRSGSPSRVRLAYPALVVFLLCHLYSY